MRLVLAAIALAASSGAHAVEYRALGERPAILYDAPSSKADRLFHLTGDNDKGEAADLLMRCYRREHRLRSQSRAVESVGIGESLDDVPLLAAVDHPILAQKPDGSFDTSVLLPRLVRTRGIGPKGWNDAVLKLLRYSFSNSMDGMDLAG